MALGSLCGIFLIKLNDVCAMWCHVDHLYKPSNQIPDGWNQLHSGVTSQSKKSQAAVSAQNDNVIQEIRDGSFDRLESNNQLLHANSLLPIQLFL